QDAKAAEGEIEVEIADRLDRVVGKPDLFLGLAHGGGGRRRVVRIDLAAGKRDLPGVACELPRALREQHGPVRTVGPRPPPGRAPTATSTAAGRVAVPPARVHSSGSWSRSPRVAGAAKSCSAAGTSSRSRARARSKKSCPATCGLAAMSIT